MGMTSDFFREEGQWEFLHAGLPEELPRPRHKGKITVHSSERHKGKITEELKT
jgi:hypothetical protein